MTLIFFKVMIIGIGQKYPSVSSFTSAWGITSRFSGLFGSSGLSGFSG
jgi:hypothetical protein